MRIRLTGPHISCAPPVWPRPPQSQAASPSSSAATTVMRLGLRLEQRADVRRLVDVLAGRLGQATSDLAAAVHEVHQLQANNAALAAQLEAAAAGGGLGPPMEQGGSQLMVQVRRTRLATSQQRQGAGAHCFV